MIKLNTLLLTNENFHSVAKKYTELSHTGTKTSVNEEFLLVVIFTDENKIAHVYEAIDRTWT